MLIEHKDIYEAIKYGAKKVISQKEVLNDYNVFPVYDKDTGNNLSALMKSILDKIILGNTLDETLESVADAALMGSRGNSGLIFSQFLYGLTQTLEVYESNIDYVQRIEAGVSYAYNALHNPVEGTMITLMQKLKNYLKDESNQVEDLATYLKNMNQALKEALEHTKNELEVLGKYNVVDAGALGFVLFAEGFVQGLLDKTISSYEKDTKVSLDLFQQHEVDEDIKYRYCTEVLIQSKVSKSSILDLLSSYGNSLVVGETSTLKRIHIHTNTPDKIIDNLRIHGQILETKIDDMFKQKQAIQDISNDMVILTDSIADLPEGFIDQNPIHIYPVGILMDDTVYYDKLTISNKNIFDHALSSKVYPTSFTPSIKSLEMQIEFLLKYYKKIIILTVSSKMSGINNLFHKAVLGYKDKDMLLIDSKQNSVSQGLLVEELASWINVGKSFEEIKQDYKDLIERTQILVHVDTLDYMVRSGRIKKSLGRIGKLLRLKPVVSINEQGEGVVLGKSIGQKKNIQKIIKMVVQAYLKTGIQKYAIVHASNLKLAEKIKTEIIKKTGLFPTYIGEISSVIAMNSGIGSVAVGFIRKERL